jgi:hypothetical protein
MTDTEIFPRSASPRPWPPVRGPATPMRACWQAFAQAGLADHMQADVLRGMVECKQMLRQVWGTKNTYTFGVAGTGWSGSGRAVERHPAGRHGRGFVNGTFSGIDALTVRMKAATREDLKANALDPKPASVTVIRFRTAVGHRRRGREGAGRPQAHLGRDGALGNRLGPDQRPVKGFSDACLKHNVMGLVDAVSSLGIEDFAIDDSPAWSAGRPARRRACCACRLTYAPVSFTDRYIAQVCARTAAIPMCTTRSLRPGTGASSTARMYRGGQLPPHPFGLCRRRLPRGAAHQPSARPRAEGRRLRPFHEGAARRRRGDGLRGHVEHDQPCRAEPARCACWPREGTGAGPRQGLWHLADTVGTRAGSDRHPEPAVTKPRSPRS